MVNNMDCTYPIWSKNSIASESRCNHLEGSQTGKVAVIGIGNPLRKEDILGPYLVTLIMQRTGDKVCCINLESHLSHLVPVIERHEVAIIVDAVDNLESKESLLLEIDDNVRKKTSDLIECSHGISWIDELRWSELQEKKVFLFGVSSKLTDCVDSNDRERVARIEEQINRLLGFICLLNDEEATTHCLEESLGFKYA